MIVLLAVNPRVKGFPFFDGIGDKFARVKELVSTAGKDILLCIDGGVKRNNVARFAEMGAHILVRGSAVFDGKDPVENARFMLNTVKSHNRLRVTVIPLKFYIERLTMRLRWILTHYRIH